MKKTRIIIIGFGSIGQRHYKNLLYLGYKDVFVYDVASKKISKVVKTVANLDQTTLADFSVAFICTPTHLHIKYALMVARAGCHLFIEKPLFHNSRRVNELIKECDSKRLVSLVACNMRFHPGPRFLKNYLESGKLGRIYNIKNEFGFYLPAWRPRQDYRANYAARRATGGGIILDDIHEFDLLFWLNDFKSVQRSSLISNHASDLEIETEDQAVGAFLFSNGVLGTVSCDYLARRYHRACRIVGQKGTLVWDFGENAVWLETANIRRRLYSDKKYKLNNMYLAEVNYFLDCVKKKRATFNSVKTAADLLSHGLIK